MRLAVIGASSFCGSSFLKYSGLEALQLSRSNGYDLNHDVEKIVRELQAYEATHILNFASLSMVAQSWDRPADWMQTNVVGMTNLFDRLKFVKSLEKYVHFSTPEVYGSSEFLLREGLPFNPSTPYAASRAASDMALMMFARNGLPAVITRCSNVYGEGQQPYRLIPKAVRCALNGEVFTLEGDGSAYRAYIHAEDMTACLLKILAEAKPHRTHFISGNQFASVLEVLNIVQKYAGHLKTESVPQRLGLDSRYMLLEDGWFARKKFITLDEGIKRVVDWMKANPQKPAEYVHKINLIDQDMICVG